LTIAKSETHTHWLAALAAGAGLLPPGDVIEVAPGTPLPEAWDQVAGACGLSDQDLAVHVAARHRLSVADLKAASASTISLVPEKVARRHVAIPIRANDRQITVAVANPSDLDLEQALGFVSAREAVFEIVLRQS
jgi:hypothetical protein